MLNSLAVNTYKQYDSILKLWWPFCEKQSTNPLDAPITSVLLFLTERFESNASYGTINTARSALSLLLGPEIGKNDSIKRFVKGVFRSKPPKPKYDVTWDPGIVLNYLVLSYPNCDIGIEQLSKKLVTILALTTGHRVQTLSYITIDNIHFHKNGVKITIPDLIKTSKPGSTQPVLHLPYFREKIEICPVKTLESYITITKAIRGDIKKLIITYKKPQKSASSQTISRWIKATLDEAGIDTNIFSGHSTRHSSTSAAKRLGVSIDLIRKTAGWTKNSSTFARFYNRPLLEDPTSFSDTICSSITE
jgi:integrase